MTDLVKVTIDDREVEVEKGTGLVETAAAAGIEIPVFCYEPGSGRPSAPAACASSRSRACRSSRPAARSPRQEGMVVRTARHPSARRRGRRGTLEFILVNHPLDCPVCDKGGECPLQDLDVPLRAWIHRG
jgi:NADH-quinone oxidoreductase subunit G